MCCYDDIANKINKQKGITAFRLFSVSLSNGVGLGAQRKEVILDTLCRHVRPWAATPEDPSLLVDPMSHLPAAVEALGSLGRVK